MLVRIYFKKDVDNMFWEFPNIFKAAEFVKDLAEWEIQKSYSKNYISRAIFGVSENWISVLKHLGLSASFKFNDYIDPPPGFGYEGWLTDLSFRNDD